MDDTPQEDSTSPLFQEDVAKEITTEASPDSWQHARPGDVVTLEIEEGEGAARCQTRTWVVGAGKAHVVADLDMERCVRTMRCGERATMRSKRVEGSPPLALQLLGVERTEDIFGDGRLLRTSVQEGSGWATPRAGSELRLRFAWRAAEGQQPEAAAGAAEDVGVLLAEPAEQWAAAAATRELGDLRRALLRHFGGAVVTRTGGPSAPAAGSLLLRVERSGEAILGGAGGLGPAEARAALEAQAPLACAARREAREVTVSVEEGSCSCSAEDWIPGAAGLRVLSDLRAGQRCLVHVAPELAFGSGLPELGLAPGTALEYDLEVLNIMTLEDVSLFGSGGVTKKVTTEGSGYERPAEGAEVTLRLEAREDVSGAVLVEEREVTFEAASGRLCSAVDETVLTMKRGEVCEVRCTDAAVCCDSELGLQPCAGTAVVFHLELLELEKLDLSYSREEADRVAHCTRRKEVGTRFFQEGSWQRALKRYQHVTSTLMYIDHWKDSKARCEAEALRRVCHLNAAACWLKLGVWREAEQSCALVLKEEPQCVKALFRRGQALKELGEYREAEQSMRKVLEFDKENKEAARMLPKLRQWVKTEVEQQREMFSRMARGIGSGGAEDATEAVEAVEAAAVAEPLGAAGALGARGATAAAQAEAVARASPWLQAWPWGLLALLVAGSSLGLGLLVRRRRH